MRWRLNISLAFFLALPAGLFPAGPGLQSPGYRAAWGVWTSRGYRVGRDAGPVSRRSSDRVTVYRAGAWVNSRYGTGYTAVSVPPGACGGGYFRGRSIGPTAQAGSQACYGYGGRYASDIGIMSPRQYRAARGAMLGRR